MDAIIPAAGLASRMRGMPKFLLPADVNYKTLLEIHIEQLSEICKNVYIATRPDLISLIESLNFKFKNINVMGFESKSMSETVLKTIDYSESESFILVMPDTYFYGDQPYDYLDSNPEICDLACWKIRDKQRGKLGEVSFDNKMNLIKIVDKQPENGFEYAWGALTFSRKLLKYIEVEDPHIGYAVKNALASKEKVTVKTLKGSYYDCGTPEEYLELFSKIVTGGKNEFSNNRSFL